MADPPFMNPSASLIFAASVRPEYQERYSDTSRIHDLNLRGLPSKTVGLGISNLGVGAVMTMGPGGGEGGPEEGGGGGGVEEGGSWDEGPGCEGVGLEGWEKRENNVPSVEVD